MENTEKKPASQKGRLLAALCCFAAAMLLASPVSSLLAKLTSFITVIRIDWLVPFRLVMLFSGLYIANSLIKALLYRWNPKTSHGRTASTLASSALRYVLAFVGLMWTLAIFGVDVRALLAGAGIVALVIGFGAESLIADVVTGIFMMFERQYEVGDIIAVGDFRGTVTQIGIRTTSITDSGGNTKIINNSGIRNLINRSVGNSSAVCDIAVPYSGSLQHIEDTIGSCLPQIYSEHPELFVSSPEYLGVQQIDYARNLLTLRISALVKEENIYSAQRVINRKVLLALEQAQKDGCEG